MEKQFSMFRNKTTNSNMTRKQIEPRSTSFSLSRDMFTPQQSQQHARQLGRNFTRAGRSISKSVDPKRRGCRSCGGAR